MSKPGTLEASPAVEQLHEDLGALLDQAKRCFKGQTKITLVVRNADIPGGDADVVIGDDELDLAIAAIRKRQTAPSITTGGIVCIDNSPAWFTGRWRDWHRGHGCDKDDGKPRTPEGAAEIERGGRA